MKSIQTSLKTNSLLSPLSGENYTGEELAEYGQAIKEEIEKVDGIAKVAVEGQIPKEIQVVCDISKLDMYDLSLDRIGDLLMAQNLSIPSGSINYSSGEISVQHTRQVHLTG